MVRASGSQHSRGARDDPDDRHRTWGSRGGSSALSVISVPLATLPPSVCGPDSCTHQGQDQVARFQQGRGVSAPRGSRSRTRVRAETRAKPSRENCGCADRGGVGICSSQRAACPLGGVGGIPALPPGVIEPRKAPATEARASEGRASEGLLLEIPARV